MRAREPELGDFLAFIVFIIFLLAVGVFAVELWGYLT